MAKDYNVSALPAYVEQHTDEMLANVLLKPQTLQYMRVQTGVKGSTAINILNVKTELQDGSACGFNAAGEDVFSQRIIAAKPIKVNKEWCPEKLLGKYSEYLVRVAAGREVLPFEEKLMEGVNIGVANELDANIWLGDTSKGGSRGRFDGLIKIMEGDGAVVDVAIEHAASKMSAVASTLAAIPATELREGTRMFCSPKFFAAYTQELVAANLYHYMPAEDAVMEMNIPGSIVKLTAVGGLTDAASVFDGKEYLVVANEDNLVFGTDMEDDKEVYKLWFSDDDDNYKLKIRFIGGVNFAFPDRIVLGTIAAM